MKTSLIITVTSREAGSPWALSPYSPQQGVAGAPVYIVPTYAMTLAKVGPNPAAVPDFKVIRFGIKRTAVTDAKPSPPQLRCDVGLFQQQEFKPSWIPTYRVHSGPGSIPGAWQLTGNFLIHEGSPDPSSPWGTYGCIEVVGRNEWKRFLDSIKLLSGEGPATVGAQRLLTVKIQAASAPMARLK